MTGTTEKKDMRIGFCGLGAMGFGMAANLVKEGYHLKGFDVFQKSIDRFEQAGGVGAKSLEDSAVDAEHYIVMVANAAQAQDVLFDNAQAVIPLLPKNAVLYLTSTVPSSYAQSVAAQLVSCGRSDIYFIDCPVSGGSTRAANGTLSIMAGASDAAIEQGRSLLQEMSDQDKLYIVPGGIGMGSNMKMAHQVLAGVQILAASEVMGLAARLGLEAAEVRQRILDSDAWSWMFDHRSPRILEEDYFPGVSALTIILKDVGIITSQARLHAFPTPLISAAEQAYLTGLSLGYGPNDDAGMVRLYFKEPLKTVSSSKSSGTEKLMAQVVLLHKYICIAAAAEAIAFASYLKIDLAMFYRLAGAAAGGSAMFTARGKTMIDNISQGGSLLSSLSNVIPSTAGDKAIASSGPIDDAVSQLSEVVQAAQNVKCPLFVGAATLNLFMMARRRGLGKQGDDKVIRMWDL